MDIGECPGVVGVKADSREKVVVKEWSVVAICGLSGQVWRSDGAF